MCLFSQRLFNLTQTDRGIRKYSKSSIKRFSECGVESVDVDQCVRWDSIKGQNPSRIVHIHCYSVGDIEGGEGGGGRGEEDGCFFGIVPHRITLIRAEQTPGLMIPSKPTSVTVSSNSNSSVAHRYIHFSSHLNLPVTTTGQASLTKQLRDIKSVWMVRIRLTVLHTCSLLVVVRQSELSVHCV